MTHFCKHRYGKLCHTIRKFLLKISLEQLVCFGIKPHMAQRQLMVVYIGYTILGTLLLSIPFASKGDISFIDHLFTAVSAISTTGLATVDVASQYTFFGQAIILLLIQMGGFGYMTLSSYIMLKLTKRLGAGHAKLFRTQFSFPDTIDSESMLRNIVNFTLFFEFLGFILLCPYFVMTNEEQPIWSAIFHSISAFCTAGFSIYTDNLIRFQTDIYVNVVIMVLSIIGAMGFILVTDVIRIFLRKNYKITFTSKVILTITGGLTLWSTLHLFFCEASFQHMLVGDKFLVSLFQAVSAMTTAGYNTVDVSLMASISMFILAMTMYIGASPSGTGGGLKSTTLSAIYAYTKNKLGLRKNVSLRGNIIPAYRVETALTTAFFYTFILFTGIYLIGLFEPSDADFLEISFEAASALATAGLTSGILSEISIGSKITLIILMYIGRVGVITFGNAILIHSKRNVSEKNNDMVV